MCERRVIRSKLLATSVKPVSGQTAPNDCEGREMMEVLMPNNYDRTTHLYWFRKLERHPDEGVQALAEGF